MQCKPQCEHQIQQASHRHCALYKFTDSAYLPTTNRLADAPSFIHYRFAHLSMIQTLPNYHITGYLTVFVDRVWIWIQVDPKSVDLVLILICADPNILNPVHL